MALRQPACLNPCRLIYLSLTVLSYCTLFQCPLLFRWGPLSPGLRALRAGQGTAHCMADHFIQREKLSSFESRLKSLFFKFCIVSYFFFFTGIFLEKCTGRFLVSIFLFLLCSILPFVSPNNPHTHKIN